MQTTANEAAAVADASAQAGTLGTRHIPLWLTCADESHRNAQLLVSMYDKRRKPSPASEALWGGHCATLSQAIVETKFLRDIGGLLFFGQPKAIAAAQAMEQERRLAKNAKLLGVQLSDAAA